jgi:anti-sigma factor RsiW
MGIVHPRPLLCERTRAWVSQALDCELSEFERALVQAHLERCADCAAFADDVSAATAALRAAPLEPLPYPVRLPARRRRTAGVLRVGAAAAALAGAIGLAGILSIAVPSSPSTPAPYPAMELSEDELSELRAVTREFPVAPPPPDPRLKPPLAP